VGIRDPAERIREISHRCQQLRHDPALSWTEEVAAVLNLLPSSITGGMLTHVDLLASNVPGFDLPVYVGGAKLIGLYPFGPTTGSAANITLMSYRETCHIGTNVDAGAVKDHAVLADCLREGFEDVLGLLDSHVPVIIAS